MASIGATRLTFVLISGALRRSKSRLADKRARVLRLAAQTVIPSPTMASIGATRLTFVLISGALRRSKSRLADKGARVPEAEQATQPAGPARPGYADANAASASFSFS
jgi:hypothetical protein